MTENPVTPEVTEDAVKPDDGTAAGIRLLENELKFARRNAKRLTKRMHTKMAGELRAAERRVRTAEQKAAAAAKRAEADRRLLVAARKRAERAERELAEVRASTTWKAGRAVVAVPARLKRLRRG